MVFFASLIWRSLTGRRASINKVTRAGSHNDRPDFAIFVGNIATFVCNHEPTLDEIQTAFRTSKATKNKMK